MITQSVAQNRPRLVIHGLRMYCLALVHVKYCLTYCLVQVRNMHVHYPCMPMITHLVPCVFMKHVLYSCKFDGAGKVWKGWSTHCPGRQSMASNITSAAQTLLDQLSVCCNLESEVNSVSSHMELVMIIPTTGSV